MRYVVSGGTGFLGSALVLRLLKKGHEVTVIDNNSRGSDNRLKDVLTDINFIHCDIRDIDAVNKASKGAESFIHLAAINGTENFYKDPKLVLDVGVRGMLSALEACMNNNIGELVLASSSETYQTASVIPTAEEVPLIVPNVMNPRYSYGGSKIISELLAINYTRSNFDRSMIFRPHNVYGSDMGWEHVLPQFVIRAAEEIEQHPLGPVPYKILGDGKQTRAFIYIDDFIDGLMLILGKGQHHGIYNIGNPEEITIAEVARKVVRCFSREPDIIPGSPVPGETKRRCPDISKLKALGFAPRIDLDHGLPYLVSWYKDNKYRKPRGGNPFFNND